jgi:predicted secreted protein
MKLGEFIAVYFVVWWTILFAVLPWGVRTQEEEGEIVLGTERSAPARPMLIRKALVTSIVAAILVGGTWWVFTLVDFDMAKLAAYFGFTAAP